MLIAKPEWFKMKKTNGFKIFDYPWQSVAYLLLMVLLPFAIDHILPKSIMVKIISTTLFLFLFINGLIAYQKSLDERQRIIYAICERNAFWGIAIAFMVIQAILPFLFDNINKEDIIQLMGLPLVAGGLIAFITLIKLDPP